MEEILHHLGGIKPCKIMGYLPHQLLSRISEPSTVCLFIAKPTYEHSSYLRLSFQTKSHEKVTLKTPLMFLAESGHSNCQGSFGTRWYSLDVISIIILVAWQTGLFFAKFSKQKVPLWKNSCFFTWSLNRWTGSWETANQKVNCVDVGFLMLVPEFVKETFENQQQWRVWLQLRTNWWQVLVLISIPTRKPISYYWNSLQTSIVAAAID